MDSERTEIISKKIEEFVTNNKDDFLKLLAQIEKKTKWIMKRYYKVDEHGGLQMFINATEKMENGERNWDYENVKIEAMIFETACSLATNELKKLLKLKTSFVNYEDLAGEDNGDDEEDGGNNYERTDLTVTMPEISERTIIEMVKENLMLVDGDIDLISIEVMEALTDSDAETKKELATILKIEENEVRNALDRIKRAGNKVWAKLGKTDKEYLDNLKIDYRMKDVLRKIKDIDDERDREEENSIE